MEKRIFISNIYDFYSVLLTEHQKAVFGMYFLNDFSLQEVADELNITRQAVNDLLKRTEKTLLEYEDKLKLYEKYIHLVEKADSIKAYLVELIEEQKLNDNTGNKIIKIIDAMID